MAARFLPDNVSRFSKRQTMFMSICAAAIMNVINVSSVTLAWQEYADQYACPLARDICSAECAQTDYAVNPSFFLQIAGLVMIVLSVIGSILLCVSVLNTSNASSASNAGALSTIQTLLHFVIATFCVSWASMGLSVHSQLRHECRISPKGQMLLAWSIVYLLYGILKCCTLYGSVKQKL